MRYFLTLITAVQNSVNNTQNNTQWRTKSELNYQIYKLKLIVVSAESGFIFFQYLSNSMKHSDKSLLQGLPIGRSVVGYNLRWLHFKRHNLLYTMRWLFLARKKQERDIKQFINRCHGHWCTSKFSELTFSEIRQQVRRINTLVFGLKVLMPQNYHTGYVPSLLSSCSDRAPLQYDYKM